MTCTIYIPKTKALTRFSYDAAHSSIAKYTVYLLWWFPQPQHNCKVTFCRYISHVIYSGFEVTYTLDRNRQRFKLERPILTSTDRNEAGYFVVPMLCRMC